MLRKKTIEQSTKGGNGINYFVFTRNYKQLSRISVGQQLDN